MIKNSLQFVAAAFFKASCKSVATITPSAFQSACLVITILNLPGQWFVNRFKCFTPHDHRHAPGGVLEKFQVVGQMPEQLVVFTNGIIFGSSYN